MPLMKETDLKGAANLLVMPNLDAANITFNALRAMTDGLSVGPVLLGLKHPAHILQEVVTTRGVLNMIAVAVVEAQTSMEQRLPF